MKELRTGDDRRGEPAVVGARRRLEDVKLLSLAASLLAFGGLTATVAVAGSSLAVKAATTTSAQSQAADPAQASDPAPPPASDLPAAAPLQPPVAAPPPASRPIVSAQS